MVRKGAWRWRPVRYCLIIAAALIQSASAAVASTPTTSLLVNGDFETGPFDTLGVVTGWTVGGSSKILSSMQGATSGTHSAALSATGDSQNNVLSQSFVTIPGRLYSLDFDTGIFGINFNGPMLVRIEVFGNGGPIINQTLAPIYAGTYNQNRITFAHYHYVFTADSTVTTLRFTDISASNAGADVEVDSVSVALHVTSRPGTYSARDLGAAAGFGRAINIFGQIAGQAGNHAYVTAPNGGSITDLGTLPGGVASTAVSINRFGQVAGDSQTGGGPSHAFFSGPNGFGLTDLGSFDSGGPNDLSSGSGINDSGRVAGHSLYPSRMERAFLSAPNGKPITDIGSLDGFGNTLASGINASGQVSGYGTVNSETHAFLSGPNGGGPLQDLGTFGGNYSYAVAMNDTGQVTGLALTSSGTGHWFRTASNGNNMTAISLSDDNTFVYGINSCGQVVGDFRDPGHALICNSTGGITDLHALVSPQTDWVIVQAQGINDQGQIVAWGVRYTTNQEHTFLLTPNLDMERADNSTVTLFWPGSCAGPAVEEATMLGAAADWQEVTTQPTVVDGTYSFTRSISAANSAHFYRLSFVTGDQPQITSKSRRRLHSR